MEDGLQAMLQCNVVITKNGASNAIYCNVFASNAMQYTTNFEKCNVFFQKIAQAMQCRNAIYCIASIPTKNHFFQKQSWNFQLYLKNNLLLLTYRFLLVLNKNNKIYGSSKFLIAPIRNTKSEIRSFIHIKLIASLIT